MTFGTVGAALDDSPVGTLAWLLHRRHHWSDHDGDVEQALTQEFLLTSFSLAWFTRSMASAIRFYWSMVRHPWRPSHDRAPVVEAPTGLTLFGKDITSQSRFWVDDYVNLVRVGSYEAGGHFMAAERPDVVVEEIRSTFRSMVG